MGYYLTMFAQSSDEVSVTRLRQRLFDEGLTAIIAADEGMDEHWEAIELQQSDGEAIAFLERLPVEQDSDGFEIVEEYLGERLEGSKPTSAEEWVRRFLLTVKTVYSIQILSGVYAGAGWEALTCVQYGMRQALNAIMHGEAEGFSNVAGHQITWEFGDPQTGTWEMAVLNENGEWDAFEMNMGNLEHRKAFLDGRVPEGVKRLP